MTWEKQLHYKACHLFVRGMRPCYGIGVNVLYKPDISDMFRSPAELRLKLNCVLFEVTLLITMP